MYQYDVAAVQYSMASLAMLCDAVATLLSVVVDETYVCATQVWSATNAQLRKKPHYRRQSKEC